MGNNTGTSMGNNMNNSTGNANASQQQQQPMNPGISEREIEEILASSGVINGMVTDGVKLGNAIADIIVKNNQLLMQAIQSGNLNQAPLEDFYTGGHQTAQPTRMWAHGDAPGREMPKQDIQANAQPNRNGGGQQQGQGTIGAGQNQQNQ